MGKEILVRRILRLPDVIATTGLSRSSILRAVSDGRFPKPINLGGKRAIGWVSTEVDNWIDACINESRGV